MDLTERLLAGGEIEAEAHAPDADVAWAASGAMALTGRADGAALLAPRSVAPTLDRLARRFGTLAAAFGRPVPLDGPALLGERAALTGARRAGRVSVGGSTRLLAAADGWVAVCLARAADRVAVPAWLDTAAAREADDDDPWPSVTCEVARRPAAELVERAVLLGLPCGRVGETASDELAVAALVGDAPPVPSLHGLVVADLSSLWAGPLCTDLLGRAGATVVKIESAQRPDGARLGHPAFFRLLNAGKRSAVVDLAEPEGRARLAALVTGADVVVEASRPRALAQLGVDAAEVLRTGRPLVWCSITGHGRHGDVAHRVGFGDDAAVAGGLVAWEGDRPRFCADAVADPASGLVAATAVLDRLAAGGRWLVDVALARTAAALAAGPTTPAPWSGPVAAPRARAPRDAP